MSDGPHRSLNMRRWWRELARRADQSAFDISEVSDAMIPAIERELFAEVTPDFLKDFKGLFAEPTLFNPLESPQFEVLRAKARYGMESFVLDNVAILTPEELAQFNCVQSAFTNAVVARTPRYLDQVEEHYERERSASRARRVRARLDEALSGARIGQMVERILQSDERATPSRVTRKTGIDEGVRMR